LQIAAMIGGFFYSISNPLLFYDEPFDGSYANMYGLDSGTNLTVKEGIK